MRSAAARWLSKLAYGSGLDRALHARRRRNGDFRLFVLAYHEVAESVESEGVISAARLERHLSHLAAFARFSTVSQAIDHLVSGAPLDRDLVAITFDDGYQGNARRALPVLRRHDATATVYLTSGFLDGAPLWFDALRRSLEALAARRGSPAALASARALLRRALPETAESESPRATVYRCKRLPPRERERLVAALSQLDLDRAAGPRALSWDEARSLAASGVELGGHTATHPILSLLDETEQEREIAICAGRILEETGTSPVSFAYPNGSARDFDARTVRALRRSGFVAACSMLRGSNRPGALDPFALHRIGVGADSVAELDTRLAALFDEPLRRVMARATASPASSRRAATSRARP